MATADQLLELMFSWIEQRENCAKQLKKLAQELESLREKCNASECVGNTVAVVGSACLIGAGVATFLTAGAAAPFLGLLGAAYSGVGFAVSVGTKITEHFLSSNTMKEAQNIDKKSNEITNKIQKLFEQLKAEWEEASSSADPDDLDRHIMTEILKAMARHSGLDQKINFRKLGDEPKFFFDRRCIIRVLVNTVMVGVLGILAFFTFKLSGKKSKCLFAKGSQKLIKLMSTTAFKTALKGGATVVGGAVGMAFALSEAIDSWKEQIKKNHVTEASQSLRDTADAILKMTQTLRGQFDNIKKMLVDIAKRQQEEEEKLSRDKNKTQDCTFHFSPLIQINMKMSIFAGVLLLSAALLSADVLSVHGGNKVKHDVKWFTNQHIAEEMKGKEINYDCTNMIKGRGIMKDDGRCKWSNTFIIAPLEALKAICNTTEPVKPNSNIHQSTMPFDLYDCLQTMESAQNKDKFPNCVYKKGEFKKQKRIEIGCDKKGNPIHLQGFLG
ncbi:uncharacterized protein LOC120565851 [Perca fluviatilis]|nr:uncharacterized protein LOC120565851 [Perca fluviatilis]